MLASVYRGNRTLGVDTVAVPEVDDDGVLVEVNYCGICGTDLHTFMEDWGSPGPTGGHEWSGVIAEVGSLAAAAGWRTGDRVVGGPSRGCDECEMCLEGFPQLCLRSESTGASPFMGAFARYKAARAVTLYRLPDSLDLRTAALTEPLAVAYRGVQRSGILPGQRALVTGGGPIGQLTIAVLRAQGVDDIVLSEPTPARRTQCAALGATVVEPDQLPATPARSIDVATKPFHAAFECSGRVEAMEAALGLLGRHGVLILSGVGRRRPRFDPIRIVANELVVMGSREYTPADYSRSIDLLAAGALPVELLVEPEDVPLDQVQRAMERLFAGELVGKVLVVPTEGPLRPADSSGPPRY
jgi:(R,R)-butanediol dehydrogenase / meso-butanediol dehydrogenase / diacetyl reductase